MIDPIVTNLRNSIPHLDSFVHLNNAAGSLPDLKTHEAMRSQLEREARMGSTEAMQSVAAQLAELYPAIGQLLGIPEQHVFISSSNTYAWQTAFAAVPLCKGDRVLVGATEWGGNLSTIWQRCRHSGAVMEVIPSDVHGVIDVASLSNMLDDQVAVVCVTEVSAVNGLVNPVGVIADILDDHPAWLFVDAAQSFGQVTITPHARTDVMSVSARKYLRAPRGTGFASLSARFLKTIEPTQVDQFSGPWGLQDNGNLAPTPKLRQDARHFEFGETSYAVRMGLLSAVLTGLDSDWMQVQLRIADLAHSARTQLAAIDGLKVHDTADTLSGLVTFSHERISPAAIVKALRGKSINIAAPASVYAPLWFRDHPLVARMSPHAFNVEDEIARAVDAVTKVAATT